MDRLAEIAREMEASLAVMERAALELSAMGEWSDEDEQNLIEQRRWQAEIRRNEAIRAGVVDG